MKKRIKLRLRETFMILVCLSVCAFFINLFWQDLNKSTTRNDKDQIGTIFFKYKVAQRKFSDRVVWERLQQSSPLYNADTIRTSDAAMASVSFIDGTKIEMNENTMLQIFYNENGVRVSVGGGDIDVDTTSAISAVSVTMQNGSTLSLDVGSYLVATANVEGDNSFNLKTGNANVVNKTGQVQNISSGESVKVESSGHISKNPVTVTSISGDTKLLSYQNEKQTVEVKWTATDSLEDENVIVQTSTSKNFENILNVYNEKGSSQIEVPVESGTVYWRVFPEKSPEDAVSGKISKLKMEEVQVSSPLNNASYRYRKGSSLPVVNFNWKADDFVTSYKFEVSVLPNFEEVLSAVDCKNPYYTLNSLDAGTYYWRVTPYYTLNNIGYAKSSKSHKFTIIQEEKLLPPSLSIPANNSVITLGEKPSEIQFMWKSNIKTADYNLEIADSKTFENVVYSMDTSDKRFSDEFNINILPEGTYYWKVTRDSSEDETAAVSKIRQFSIKKYVPGVNKLVYPPDNYSVEAAKMSGVTFAWKLADEYEKKSSVFQISSDSEFTDIVKEQVVDKLQADRVSVKKGTYYWRIGTENSEGNMIYTDPRRLSVISSLSVPSIKTPADKETVIISDESMLKVAWAPVENADYYKVKLTDGKDNSIVKEINNIKDTQIIIDDFEVSYEPESYKCSVQAFTEESEVNESQGSAVAVVNVLLREPKPVNLVYPLDNKKIEGLAAIRKPVEFKWNEGDEIVKSSFVLRKVLANGTTRIVNTIDNPDSVIKLNRLTEGKYQWTINATGKNGIKLDAENSGTFTVTAVPELSKAVLTVPEQNFIIGPDYLKKNRRVNFNWKPVAGANQYTFVLYQKLPNGKLKKIIEDKTGKSTEYRLKDLSILDVGNFQWTVTASCYAKDGFLEQKSKAAVGEFKISFDLPSTVETIEPGRMYGN